MIDLVAFIPRAIVQSIPLLCGSTGETLTEKSGNLNLGIPGIMYVGAISGVIGAFFYERTLASPADINPVLGILIPLLCSLLGSLVMGLIYSFLTVTLRANQNVTGLAITTFGVGFGNFFGGSLIKLTGADVPSIALSATSACFSRKLPFAESLGWVGKIFFSCLLGALLMGLLYCFLTVTLRANQNVTGLALTTFGVGIGNFFGGSLIKLSGSAVPSIALTNISAYFHNPILYAPWQGDFGKVFLSYGWLAYLAIAVALAASYVLRRTRTGLHLRAVGESPNTADAAGINVARYKYGATCIGSMVAGLGGLYYVMDYASGVWSNNAFGDRGWLAIALVIFTIWRPNVGVLASFLFGGLYILHMYIPTGTNLAVKELYKMAPYVVTLLVLILTSLRNQREKQPPQHLGLPYFREER